MKHLNTIHHQHQLQISKPFSYFYPCGTKLAAGEIYDVKSKVSMISMGKCGDPRFMDIPVLPGEVDLLVSIDGVPQIQMQNGILKLSRHRYSGFRVDPPPQPGEKYVVKLNGVYQEGIPAREAYVDYIQTRETNTFTEYCTGLVPSMQLIKIMTTMEQVGLMILSVTFFHSHLTSHFIITSLLLVLHFMFQQMDLAFNIPTSPAPSSIPNTSYWLSWYYNYAYRDYTIMPLGNDQNLYYRPSQGNDNSELQIYYYQPYADELRVRWQT
ncbi:MAG: hypothetical protein R2883_00230 [Caldisericia bacterium]